MTSSCPSSCPLGLPILSQHRFSKAQRQREQLGPRKNSLLPTVPHPSQKRPNAQHPLLTTPPHSRVPALEEQQEEGIKTSTPHTLPDTSECCRGSCPS